MGGGGKTEGGRKKDIKREGERKGEMRVRKKKKEEGRERERERERDISFPMTIKLCSFPIVPQLKLNTNLCFL